MAGFGWTLNIPYFTGTLTVAADSRYDVGLAGHAYMVDWDREGEFRRESVPLLRQQVDQGQRPGEQSINPNGLWRRTVESWHGGAGQSWLDRTGTNPFRYDTSKGVDPWDKYGLTLLPDTALADAQTESNLWLAVAGGRLYAAQGQGVRVTGVDDETFADATGLPAADVLSLASDGSTCYAACGASGIYSTADTVFASYVTGDVDLVRYARGRLMAASGAALYNPVAAGALPTALFVHPSAGWTWTDITEGPGHIYACGYAGDKSAVYRTTIKSDGSGLDVPEVAMPLPDGELAMSVTGYAGFVIVGTSLGARFAVPDSNGNLTLGSLIPSTSPVLCGEGQDRFVWYGLTDYDAASTGLGRIDLQTFTNDLTPAYASDLMATGQGDVQAVATYRGKRWFTVAAAGLYRQAATKVASGTIAGGRVGYGLPDTKTALYIGLRHDHLPAGASVRVDVAVDGATAAVAGTSQAEGSTEPLAPFELTDVAGNDFEWTLTLTGDVVVRSVFLLADPSTTSRAEFIYVPVLLRDHVKIGSVDTPVDVIGEHEYLDELRDTRRVVTYQEGTTSRRVIVEDTEWRPWRKTSDRRGFQGTYLLKMKGV